MKKNYFLIVFCFITYFTNAQAPFITTWQVTANDLSIQVPIIDDDEIPDNYTIDFGDGTILTNQSGMASHTYSAAGAYNISISGNFTRIKFAGPITYGMLIGIEQWGDIQWTSMEEAFKGCLYLNIMATDVPNLSQVTNMSSMFYGCTNFNTSINNWDVSNITDMSYLFYECLDFSSPLSDWDVSNVTNMSHMFYRASVFDQPIGNWNVSNVTNMSYMFYWQNFNQPIGNWDVSSVTDMSYMFALTQFNQPINDWNVSNVINMEAMFGNITDGGSFNQPLDNWDVSNVTNMRGLFSYQPSFNQSLNNWDVSNVTDMNSMFRNATSFNQPIDNWDVSNVTDMNSMFRNATSFNQPLNNWNTSNVTKMSYMFKEAFSFNGIISNWGVSNVTDMREMFDDAESFNQDISSWNFNSDIFLGSSASNYSFVANTNLDTDNYDALLNRFAQLALSERMFRATGLQYCDYGVRDYLINELGWDIFDDSLSENCGDNTLSGTILFDENANGCDENDVILNNILVNIASNTDAYNLTTATNDEGVYDLNMFEGTYSVSIVNLPDYVIATPATAEISFGEGINEEELNFCITVTETIEDLNITLLPIDDARPGFESDYQLIVENMGTQTVANATVTLSFDETLQTFMTATPAAATTTTNQLTFTLENVLPFENRIITFTMQTFTPPTVNGGEIADFTATVTPNNNDNTPNDNTFVLEQEIVNSFDPNDKRVVQGEEIFIEQASEYLDYIIRFQNTGTASAITVRIEDTISENLDWTTFKPISASHDYTVQITDGNQVEFIFNNINLPHEAANEQGSHGFIAYKIKPVAGLEIGNIINGNIAAIYFDYNLPIVTNATTTEIVEILRANDFTLNDQITIYPNPVNNILHIETKSGIQIEEVKVYNLQGSQLMQLNQGFDNINTESLSSGIYILNIQTSKGSIEYKLIKN